MRRVRFLIFSVCLVAVVAGVLSTCVPGMGPAVSAPPSKSPASFSIVPPEGWFFVFDWNSEPEVRVYPHPNDYESLEGISGRFFKKKRMPRGMSSEGWRDENIESSRALPSKDLGGIIAYGREYAMYPTTRERFPCQDWYLVRNDGYWLFTVCASPGSKEIDPALLRALDTLTWHEDGSLPPPVEPS